VCEESLAPLLDGVLGLDVCGPELLLAVIAEANEGLVNLHRCRPLHDKAGYFRDSVLPGVGRELTQHRYISSGYMRSWRKGGL
jgi:hypothetical protein